MRKFMGSEKGEGRLGFIIAAAVLVGAVYASYVMIPVRIKAYEFLDEMREQARFGAVNRKDDAVHARLLKKAKQIGLPLDAKDLKIVREGGMFVITAHYTLPIDLAVYQTEWVYNQRATAPIF